MEFASGSAAATNGYVTANQVVTFQNNASNPTAGPYTPLVPTVTATFSLSNQQYTLPATQSSNGAVLTFGGTDNAAGKLPVGVPVFDNMGYVGGAPVNDFSATQDNIGSGISMTSNYALELFTSAMGLYNANSPTNGTYYIADLTITFSTPVTNPVVHIVGLGATSGALGMTTELTMFTPGLTLTELSGSKEMDVTSTAIFNIAAAPAATTGSGAASGSVMVNGGAVTTVQFHIYLRGNGKTPTWSPANEHVGDAWLIGVSAINTFVALPLGTADFTARPRDHSVNLQWSPATNANYYIVQRSLDGTTWSSIGKTSGSEFEDNDPATGDDYYRLQLVDANGNAAYSDIREVTFAGTSLALNWYPNPVRDRLTIAGQKAIQSVTLTTLDGRILQTFSSFTPGQSVDFSRYPFGIYILVIRTADGQTHTAKIERS